MSSSCCCCSLSSPSSSSSFSDLFCLFFLKKNEAFQPDHADIRLRLYGGLPHNMCVHAWTISWLDSLLSSYAFGHLLDRRRFLFPPSILPHEYLQDYLPSAFPFIFFSLAHSLVLLVSTCFVDRLYIFPPVSRCPSPYVSIYLSPVYPCSSSPSLHKNLFLCTHLVFLFSLLSFSMHSPALSLVNRMIYPSMRERYLLNKEPQQSPTNSLPFFLSPSIPLSLATTYLNSSSLVLSFFFFLSSLPRSVTET